SISAGLDYPGVGPEHSFLKDRGRATYLSGRDDEAMHGFQLLSRLEGIIPALETAHAIAWVERERVRWKSDDVVLLCISGRGDKDGAQGMEMGIRATSRRRPPRSRSVSWTAFRRRPTPPWSKIS